MWKDIGKPCGWKHPNALSQAAVEGEGDRGSAGLPMGHESRLHGFFEGPRGGGGGVDSDREEAGQDRLRMYFFVFPLFSFL